MLAELAAWHAELPLESKVAAVIARHAPFAGRHHKDVKVGGRPLAETFTDPELDLAAFLADFRESAQLRRTPDGLSRFVRAIKFGGPMFGIFSEARGGGFRAVGRFRAGGGAAARRSRGQHGGRCAGGGQVGRDPGKPAGGRGDR